MKMTTPAFALALALSGTALAATPAAPAPKADPKMAQATEKASDDAAALVAQTRADIQKDRNAIVGAAMDLTDAQAGPFWDLYSQYRAARKPAADRLAALLIEYAKTIDTMTDAQAAKLLTEMLSIQKQEASTKADWAAKFQAKLPGKVVARFFQVDNKLDAIIMFQLAAEVPLVQ
ncbi:MAG TPA: hypothetical protein VE129_03575 [Thermoanaerobaculia bacterium]|nr:hypothetical protein [Thermoanaerobaculia bacterium]